MEDDNQQGWAHQLELEHQMYLSDEFVDESSNENFELLKEYEQWH